MKDVIFKEESFRIMGGCFAVYNDKGCGFHEPVYQECMEIELAHLGIPFETQWAVDLFYRGQKLRQHFIPDLICYGKIIVELKAVAKLCDEHRAQVLNYLNATRFTLGLLVNFGHYPKLEYERIVLDRMRHTPAPP